MLAGIFVFGSDVVTGNRSSALWNPSEERAYWLDRIDERGERIAYGEFVKQTQDGANEYQHVRAHLMGEILFEVRGAQGIAICDENFGFGCFHGFFSAGFASMGSDFVRSADKVCVERFGPLGTGCQHGIGHGIVEYLGHTDVSKALELCDDTTQVVPLLGCTSGVFMETNTPFTTLPDEQPLPPVAFSQERPFSMCEEVDERFKESCYYELAGWWETVLLGDVAKMGALCSEVADIKYQRTCTLGIGNIVGHTSGYVVEESVRRCELLPAGLHTWCRAGVAWSMYSNPEHHTKYIQVCEGLSPKEFAVCTEYTNLAEYES